MSQSGSKEEIVTVDKAIHYGENILRAYHKNDAKIDAKLLVRHLLRCDETQLILKKEMILPEHIKESYMYLIAKRAQGVPLQYITKSQEFMGLDFYVDERVLIPRQDTETLVEHLIHLVKKEGLQEIIEIGTGSGCISISLAHAISNLSITAIDISEDALEVARKNTIYHQLDKRITYVKSDLLGAYKGEEKSIDLIISNPPYISKKDCQELMEEVQYYEPLIALTDGLDGLNFYRNISLQAKKYLKPKGIIAYEIGYNQAEEVTKILRELEYVEIEVIKDLAGKDRVVVARNTL